MKNNYFQSAFKVYISLFLLVTIHTFALEKKYAPIMINDIITFVPFSEVTVSLGADKSITEGEDVVLSATLNMPNEVIAYEWSNGTTVLGTVATFSTANLSVGTHHITLTITDSNGLTSSDTLVVAVEEIIDESDLLTDETFVGTTKGEFAVNQGTANYALKIDVPHGVAGMEPEISLNYASTGGNGYLGVGWSMGGLSSITRCPQSRAADGATHKFGVNYNNDDRFCIDGQRLIAVTGTYGAVGTEYRTEIDSYAKIISKDDYYGGPKYFEVKTKSGLTYIYGQSANTYEHTTPDNVLKSWKVDKIIDTYGNTIAFHYTADYTKGIHRLSHITYADNRIDYLYEEREDILKGYHAGYPFRVDKRLKTIIVKTGATEVRRYDITYTNDQTGRQQSKVSTLTEHVAEGDLETLHVIWKSTDLLYTFNYALPQSTGILANGVDAYGNNDNDNKWYTYTPDVNGDGLSDICYRSDNGIKCFTNNAGTFSSTADIDTTICATNDNSYGGCESDDNWRTIRFIDMNADGLADLVYRSDAGMRIWKSTGSGFTYLSGNTIVQNGSDGFGGNNDDDNRKYIYTPDTNGDGLTDICYRSDSGMKCHVNQGGATFFNTPTISTGICANNSTQHGTCDDENNYDTIRFIDMDADGLQDLVYRSDEGMRIWKSNGSGFGSIPSYASSLVKNVQISPEYAPSLIRDEWKYIYTPDMNGDGLPDLCYRSHEGIKCYTNYGGGLQSTVSIDTTICAEDSQENGVCNDEDNYQTIRFVDTDADGLVDLTYRSDAGMRIWKNQGNSLASAPRNSSILQNYNDVYGNNDYDNWSTKGYFDANGDGIQDLYYRSDSGIIVYNNTSLQTLVTKITNGTDQYIEVEYKPMTDPTVYHNYSTNSERNVYDFNKISNDNIEITPAMPVVASVKSANGLGSTVSDFNGHNTIRYKYYGYIINKLRGLQGFHAMNTYDDTTQMFTTTYYKQIGVKNGAEDTDGFQFTGMPYSILANREYGVNTPLQTSSVIYKDASTRAGVYEPYSYSNIQTIYDPISKAHIQTNTHITTISNDGLGNVVESIDRTEDKIQGTQTEKTTTNAYTQEDEEAWHIGRLTSATVEHSKTGEATITKSSTFTYNDNGLLSQEVANAHSSLALTTSYIYDSHGNKASQTTSGYGFATATTTFGYDTLGKFQTSVTNAEGLSETKQYDARFGTPVSHTGPNGLTTTWKYDGLGRKIEEVTPDGTKTTWSHTYGSNYINASHALYSIAVSSKAAPFSRTYYDALGREVGSYTYAMKKGNRTDYTSRRILTRKYYNAKGELYKEELPHYQNETVGNIETTYDNYGRAIEVKKPGANNSTQTYTYSYNNFTQTVTDPKSVQKRTIKNAFGEVLSVTDAHGTAVASSINYSYDALGNLTQTTDAAGNTITMSYDNVGNKTSMVDPDLGEWHYSYNALGKLKSQWSGSAGYTGSKHASYKNYDILGRIIREMSYNRQEYNSDSNTYSYNQTDYLYGGSGASVGSRGKLLQSIASSRLLGEGTKTQTITHSYDTLGRLTQSTTNISGKGDHTSKVNYDRQSRPLTQTYPNGYTVTNHYKNGLLEKVVGSEGKVHYTINQTNAFGEVSDATFANGVRTVLGHDTAGYVGIIRSGQNGSYYTGNVQQVYYTYDGLGNVLSRNDSSITNKQINETFGYDSMNRLTSVQVSGKVETDPYRESIAYTYDTLGNIQSQTDLGNYTYYTDKPHAVKSVGTRNYTYDSVGNMTHRNGDTITYNPLNKPATMTNGSSGKEVTFHYGVGGARYHKQTEFTDTYYFGKSYEEKVEGSQVTQINYIMLGGKTIGMRSQVVNTEYDINPTNPNYKETPLLRYFHTDALGSITSITDGSGNVVERRSYEPFGKIRAMDYGLTGNNAIIPANTVEETTRAYTGHEQIAELSGLIHMNARVYDSDIGRFLSADTIIQDPHDSQSYNRYSYVRNNPLKYTDPTGHSWWTKFRDKWLKPIVSIAISAFFYSIGMAPMANAFLSGFIDGYMATGSLGEAMGGAAFSMISAGVAQGIGHAPPLQKIYDQQGGNYIKASLHGVSRAAISKARYGTGKGAFGAGFFASLMGGATEGLNGTTRVVASAIVGGTASSIGGGKFANGAMSGAFIVLFNDLGYIDKAFHDDISKIQEPQIGKKLWSLVVDNKATINIYASNDPTEAITNIVRDTNGQPIEYNIHIYKGDFLKVPLYGKGGPFFPSRTRALAHELGHTTGTLDDGGYNFIFFQTSNYRMNNINTWENPVMTPLDGIVRTSYRVHHSYGR